MRATEELRKDHEVLRAELAQLEHWLPYTHAAPLLLVNLIRTISRRLRLHTEREHAVIEDLYTARGGRTGLLPDHLLHDHEDQEQTLAILEALLTKGRACKVDRVMTYASHLIDSLREHMADKEAALFPVIDRVLADQGEAGGEEPFGPLGLYATPCLRGAGDETLGGQSYHGFPERAG